MEQAVFLGALAVILFVILLKVIYGSRKKEDGFLKHSSRGAFMRDLNKKMESNKKAEGK